MILVTGAAGKTGRAVLRALRERGEPVRAYVRSEEQATELPADEIAVGDLTDAEAVEAACAGVDRVYHICPNVHPREKTIGELVMRAAQRAGASQFAYHSVLHPQVGAMPHHWRKLEVEELLISAGIDFTILQPASYMQNLPLARIVEQGEIRVPYAVEAPFTPVDLLDVAEAAARVLCSEGHTRAIYELAGPQRLTTADMAEILGAALGRPVEAREISVEDWRADVKMEKERMEALEAMFRYYHTSGLSGNPRALAGLLGRRPTDFKRFVERELGSR